MLDDIAVRIVGIYPPQAGAQRGQQASLHADHMYSPRYSECFEVRSFALCSTAKRRKCISRLTRSLSGTNASVRCDPPRDQINLKGGYVADRGLLAASNVEVANRFGLAGRFFQDFSELIQ